MTRQISWTWTQPHTLSYQGTSKIGVVVMIWESCPQKGWLVVLFPQHDCKPLLERKFIGAEKGWETALIEARIWAEETMYPIWESGQSGPDPEQVMESWWQKAIDFIWQC